MNTSFGGCGGPSAVDVEQAIRDAAPEVVAVEFVTQPAVIGVEQLMARLA